MITRPNLIRTGGAGRNHSRSTFELELDFDFEQFSSDINAVASSVTSPSFGLRSVQYLLYSSAYYSDWVFGVGLRIPLVTRHAAQRSTKCQGIREGF